MPGSNKKNQYHKEVFAGKGTEVTFYDAPKYVERHGGKAEDWQKVKAIGTIELDGEIFEAEVHWYQCEEIGRVEIKFKGYI